MITFKPACLKDSKIIYRWRNDIITRKMSLRNTKKISWKTHQKWFKNALSNKNCLLLMVLLKQKKIGTVRFDDNVITINIAPHQRNKKLGVKIILKATKFFFQKRPHQQVIALINPINIPSIKAFEKGGYLFDQVTTIKTEENHTIPVSKYIYTNH